MQALRIDFTERDFCYFCNRRLKTKIAIIIQTEQGEISSGPICAAKHIQSIDMRKLPNLTKAVNITDDIKSVSELKKNIIFDKAKENSKAFEFLFLRCDRLNEFKGIRYTPLDNIYEKYKSGCVTADDITHINNIMVKNAKRYQHLSYKNLMACYAMKHILNIWIGKESNNKFVLGIYDFLKTKYYLTTKQIDVVNSWLAQRNMPLVNSFFHHKRYILMAK